MATKQIQHRRGTTAQHAAFTGAVAEITVDTTKKAPVVHDGVTPGGIPIAREDHSHQSLSGGLRGLLLANNATDAANDIDIAVGAARDSSNVLDLALASGITKRLDATWAVGTGNGGLDSGTKAANTGYHVYLIRRDSDGVVDALFSTSATNPTMPSGWTHRRRIGSFVTDASGNIRAFSQSGGWFKYKAPAEDVNVSGLNNPFLATLPVPGGVKVEVELTAVTSLPAGGVGWVYIRDPDLGIPSTASNNMGTFYRTGTLHGFTHRCQTDSARHVYLADMSSAATAIVYTQGYFDHRDEYR